MNETIKKAIDENTQLNTDYLIITDFEYANPHYKVVVKPTYNTEFLNSLRNYKYILRLKKEVTGLDIEKLFEYAEKYNIVIGSPINQLHEPDSDIAIEYTDTINNNCVVAHRDYAGSFLVAMDKRDYWEKIKNNSLYAFINLIRIEEPDAEKIEYKSLGLIFLKPLLSTLTIYRAKDAYLLKKQMQFMPQFAKHIYVETIQSDEKEGIEIEQQNDALVFAKWYYKEFHFAKAMNAAKSLADSTFVLKIDSDEFLLAHQMKDLYEELMNIKNKTHIDGVMFNIALSDRKRLSAMGSVLRLVRNTQEIEWIGAAHETPNLGIEEFAEQFKDKKIFSSSFLIHHTGYDATDEVRMSKAKRNIDLLMRDRDTYKYQFLKDLLIRDCAFYYNTKGQLNG